METIDCVVIYEWEYDDDFVSILSNKLSAMNITHRVFHAGELKGTLDKVKERELNFRCVLDRASDVDENAEALVTMLRRRGTRIVNDPVEIRHASDKASMHLEFITAGIYVPYTIIISPYSTQREVKLSIGELARLGRPFIIKPANTTGGGIGVVTGAEGLQEVIETRQHNKDDKYLLQKKVEPIQTNGRRAWFRPFYVFGKVLICWWDDQTHLYYEATEDEISRFALSEVDKIVRRIHDVCKLEFFSTEIALSEDRQFIVIDYVNEMCDMRIKSKHYDGVPDTVVEEIAARLAVGVRELIEQRKQISA
jgi:glutathione synthase/RimK-type ligase-like ATP-grasp enzyme